MIDRIHPPQPSFPFALPCSLWLVAAIVALAAGCSRHEEITRDTVPEAAQIHPEPQSAGPTPSPAGGGGPQQTLGAIILAEDAGWLFTLVGDPALVQPVREDFVEFVKAVRFADGNLHLFPAKEWDALPGDNTRVATISVPSGGTVLELVFSQFPRTEDVSDDEYVLLNVNRWREQMGLGPIEGSELSSETETLKAGTRDVVLVDIVADGMTGDFASGATPPLSTGREDFMEQDAQWPIEGDVPTEWVGTRNKGRVKSFVAVGVVGMDSQTVTITVSKAGGDRLSSIINRWRSHVDLPPWSADEMVLGIKKIETLGTTADYVELIGREQTKLGVVADAGGDQWFIELWGDPELAEREKDRFEAFVKSLRLKN